MEDSALPRYEFEKQQTLKDLGYEVLNRVPLLGTLVKTFLRLHAAEQKYRFEVFALTLLKGVATDNDLVEQIEGQEAEAFNTVFAAFISDQEVKKAEIYAFAYLFLVKHELFQTNPSMAEYVIRTIKDLSCYDVELMKEIYDMWEKDCTDKAMIPYFKNLELARGSSEFFDWHRRMSVQALINHGLLAKVVEDLPIWTTEQFDVVARCVQGLDLNKNKLTERRIIADPP